LTWFLGGLAAIYGPLQGEPVALPPVNGGMFKMAEAGNKKAPANTGAILILNCSK
jgi:hypothetical protein